MKKFTLRPYQQEAADAAVAFLKDPKEKGNGLIVLATGLGKSLVAAEIANQLNSDVLVFCPSKEILEQNYRKMKTYTDDCSMYSASVGKKEISKITFATIGSVKNTKSFFEHFEYIIVDECHLCDPSVGMYRMFFDYMGRKIIGMTATPYRLVTTGQRYNFKERKMDLSNAESRLIPIVGEGQLFSKVVYNIDTEYALKQGYLANLRYFDVRSDDMKKCTIFPNTSGAEFSERSLQWMEEHTDFYNHMVSIIKRLQNPKNGKKRNGILCFVRLTEVAQLMTTQIDNCRLVTGKTPKKEREQILKDFADRKFDVLLNVNCLCEETELLTERGWVGIDDIKRDDSIAQYEDGKIDFAKPLAIIHNDAYMEDFVEMDGKYAKFKVTSNHNMLVALTDYSARKGHYKLTEAKDIVNRPIAFPICGFADVRDIKTEYPKGKASRKRFISYNSCVYRKKGDSPERAQRKAEELWERKSKMFYKNPDDVTIDECKFIGFMLGDGSFHKGRYSFVQSLRNPQMCEWIERLMRKCGIHFTKKLHHPSSIIVNGKVCDVKDYYHYDLCTGRGGDGQYVPTNLSHLIPYLNKKGSELFWGFNRSQFFSLCEGLFMANGNHGNANHEYYGQQFITPHKELVDLLQAVGVCRGYNVNIGEKDKGRYKNGLYWMGIQDKRFMYVVRDFAKTVHNQKPERVWCVSMPKGTIVTRYRGRVTIMGNCLAVGYDRPDLDTVLLGCPTMSLARYYQELGRAIRPYKDKEGWIIDLGGNVKRFGEVHKLKFRQNGFGEWDVYNDVRKLTNVKL